MHLNPFYPEVLLEEGEKFYQPRHQPAYLSRES